MSNNMDWVDSAEKEQSKDYFKIVEGQQKFVLLSHCAPYAQVWEGKKYRPAVEGDTNVSIKGFCWVLQDDVIKSAMLPYTVVKEIRTLQQDPEWDFKIPFPHTFTLNAKNAGTKEVDYSLNASPKEIEIEATVLAELKKKPQPEEMVEKMKDKALTVSPVKAPDYPEEEITADDIPF